MGGRRSATVFRQDTGELVGNLIEPEVHNVDIIAFVKQHMLEDTGNVRVIFDKEDALPWHLP